eukprot:COSAG02_NODE_1744_length_11100_cov_6.084083_9_plen_340_part_00
MVEQHLGAISFPLQLHWLRFGTPAGSSSSSSFSAPVGPGDRLARFTRLCEGLAAAEKRIERLERQVRSSPRHSDERRLADLVAGIAAAERRLASLEMLSEAQEAPREGRTQRLQVRVQPGSAAEGGGGAIPSITCAGAVPSKDDKAQEAKVGAAALARGFSATTAAFCYVPADYYDRSLEERQVLLGAPNVDYLCKTIVVENRKWELAQALPPDGDRSMMAARSRYFGVVLQYGARFKKENMEREVRKRGGLTKKQCQILFADEAEVVSMTGFVHNSVTPVGSACEMPIYLSHHVDQLDYFWMGGGAVNLKLKVDTKLFKAAYGATVGLVTVATSSDAG